MSAEVDFLEENPPGGCGFGLHRSRKCYNRLFRSRCTTEIVGEVGIARPVVLGDPGIGAEWASHDGMAGGSLAGVLGGDQILRRDAFLDPLLEGEIHIMPGVLGRHAGVPSILAEGVGAGTSTAMLNTRCHV